MGLFYALKLHPSACEPVKLIVCASLDEVIYEEIEQHEKIGVVCLYCRCKERAEELRRRYKKIKEVRVEPAGLRDFIMGKESNEGRN